MGVCIFCFIFYFLLRIVLNMMCFNEKRAMMYTNMGGGVAMRYGGWGGRRKTTAYIIYTRRGNMAYARFNDFQIRNSARGRVIDGLAVYWVGGREERYGGERIGNI